MSPMAIFDKYFLIPASCLLCIASFHEKKDLSFLEAFRASFCISLLGFSAPVTRNEVTQTLGEAIITLGMG